MFKPLIKSMEKKRIKIVGSVVKKKTAQWTLYTVTAKEMVNGEAQDLIFTSFREWEDDSVHECTDCGWDNDPKFGWQHAFPKKGNQNVDLVMTKLDEMDKKLDQLLKGTNSGPSSFAAQDNDTSAPRITNENEQEGPLEPSESPTAPEGSKESNLPF